MMFSRIYRDISGDGFSLGCTRTGRGSELTRTAGSKHTNKIRQYNIKCHHHIYVYVLHPEIKTNLFLMKLVNHPSSNQELDANLLNVYSDSHITFYYWKRGDKLHVFLVEVWVGGHNTTHPLSFGLWTSVLHLHVFIMIHTLVW